MTDLSTIELIAHVWIAFAALYVSVLFGSLVVAIYVWWVDGEDP